MSPHLKVSWEGLVLAQFEDSERQQPMPKDCPAPQLAEGAAGLEDF